MAYKNGFFQLSIKEDGIYIKLFPPKEGGKPISYEDVSSYLNWKKITDFDIKKLNDSIRMAKSPMEIKIGSQSVLPERECVKIRISPDNMLAVGRFYPPSTGGKLLTESDVLSDLKQAGIQYGILDKNIKAFFRARQYCVDMLLAKGTAPIQGHNAKIAYYFNTDQSLKPKVNEDGSVNFHELEIISNVKKDEILAVLTPADYGKAGKDVLGHSIPPAKVINQALKCGKNVHLSEDGLTMYSDVSGHVHLEQDKVDVSDTYEVVADVDTSTGDIQYEGNVHVKGNVITGFKVTAKGDIIVDGVVEGATLVAGGQIVLARGIQGMNRGKLEAKGNIITKFIESCEVKAGGYVSTDAILHSKVSASGDILVNGKNGSVTGGELRSGTLIAAKTVGSTMGTHTLLEVGVDPEMVDEYKILEEQIPKMQNEKIKLEQIVTLLQKKLKQGENVPQDKMQYLQTASKNIILLETRLAESQERWESLSDYMENSDSGCVKVSNKAYPGVKIVISNVIYFVRSEQHYCRFVRDGADIKVDTL